MPAILLCVCLLLVPALATNAAWSPPGDVDLSRPRLLMRDADIVGARERIGRQPYRGLLDVLIARARQADNVALDDDGIAAHRIKARAAKNLAFLYALDRTVQDGEIVVLSDSSARQEIGDRARELLANLYPRSRLAVDPPIGGWDRDISSSEELLQYAVAYDTLVGAGYDFGDDEAVIVERIAAFAGELYDNYRFPETASSWANLHQNNHRSKVGAALVVAAIAIAEYEPQHGSDPRGVRDPQRWIDYGLDQVDFILRWVLVTGDGAYAEGPFYWKFTSENILPFALAWHRLLGGQTYHTAAGLEIRDFWTDPLFHRTARWMLDMTLPDGSMAPIDDGNPGRSYYFGLLPPIAGLDAAFAWRWGNAPTPFDASGNIDLAADAILAYDDAIPAQPPVGSPTAFYIEGGNAILRSGWEEDAVMALILGEHDTASQFGRDRAGRGVGPQSHEHAEPGAFLLHAFGERLMLDPGYLNFANRSEVNRPEHHNLILVDGQGPIDYLDATLRWNRRTGRPPIDGNAQLSGAIDTGFVDAVRVATRYGQPATRAARIQRHFLMVGDRTLVIADDIIGPAHPPQTYTWLLHGNGGGESAGSFSREEIGATWSRQRARVTTGAAFDVGEPTFDVRTATHEEPGGVRSTHRVLRASVSGPLVRALHVVHPSPTTQAVPEVTRLHVEGAIGLRVDDPDDARRLVVLRTTGGRFGLEYEDVATDGALLIIDRNEDGSLRSLWSESATFLARAGVRIVESGGVRAPLGIAFAADSVEVATPGAAGAVVLRGLEFVPQGVDGACGFESRDDAVLVALSRERRFVVRAGAANAAPGADAGADVRVAVGSEVVLDGSGSCDADGDELQARWTLQSAPAGSAWRLDGADSMAPVLVADRPGPYRVQLVVTDDRGLESQPAEVLVIAGEICADGIDNDADGLFDSDDPDCDSSFACLGDCSADGVVTVDEILLGVQIALGVESLWGCENFDRDRNLQVTIDEIMAALDAALQGCS